MNKIIKNILVMSLMVAVLTLSLPRVFSVAEERYTELQLFSKVLNLIQQYYVESIDTKKLIYGGIKGMMRELDPHTNFLTPDIFKEFESETSGEFGGLGIEITVKKGVLTVISPIEDTPAWNAGIQPGDKVVSINGESTKGLSLAEAAKMMKGKKDSPVQLGIFRDGFEEPKVYSIKRGVVKIKSVKYTDLEDGHAYIKITSFIENTYSELEKLINEHIKKNKEIKGMVIDLRRNPGGLLNQATMISDLFLEDGIIVSTIGRNEKEKEVIYAKKKGTLDKFPVVVLIDEYSASASEILAGALQDNKRALIMGKRSFGKGSVQSVVKLGDGSGLKLTVARYYTPKGISIQADGIHPDVELEEIDKDILEKMRKDKTVRREKDIRGHLLSEKEKEEIKKNSGKNMMEFWWSGDSENKKKLSAKESLLSEDFQVFQAFNYLKAWSVIKKM
jgi:carboxyl-terminal processing protease